MKTIFILFKLILVSLFLLAVTSESWAQTSDEITGQLLGSWTLVSANDERPDGTKMPMFGPNPVGLLIFLPNGSYSIHVCSVGRPKFTLKDRLKGTPEEYEAAVKGCNPHWGRYSVNAMEKTIKFNIEHALFSNWEGTEQNRKFNLNGDELMYRVPNPETAAANPIIKWKRVK